MRKSVLSSLLYLIGYALYGACPSVPLAPTVASAPACGTLTALPTGGTAIVNSTNYGVCSANTTITTLNGGNASDNVYVNGYTVIASNINSTFLGSIYVYSGSDFNVSAGNLDQAANIYIYGQMEINTVNSSFTGNIYVMPGGTLTVSGHLDGGNVYVYGTFNHATAGSALIQNSAKVYVASTGIYNTGAFTIDNASASLVVEGTVNMSSLSNFNNGSVCLNANGCASIPSASTLDITGGFQLGSANTGYVFYSGSSCPGSNKTISSTAKICAPNLPTSSNCTHLSSVQSNILYGSNCPATNCSSFVAITLPIILAFFESSVTTEGVVSSWATYSQWDSDYFIIEKSKNGVDWEQVGTLPSINGKSVYREFSITDNTPYSGISYYRLSEVDTKGNKKVYSVDYVDIDNYSSGFTMYPNPTTGDLNVNIFGGETALNYDFELVDMTGKNIVKTTLLSGVNRLGSIVTNPGMYFAKLKVGSKILTQKIVVQ